MLRLRDTINDMERRLNQQVGEVTAPPLVVPSTTQ